MTTIRRLVLCSIALAATAGCGGGGNPADQAGIGAQCATKDDCPQANQICLSAFRGGYCGSLGCTVDGDCTVGAACIRHDDGLQYCFRLCVDKSECNRNRSVQNESNCVSNIKFADPSRTAGKACVPPSSGI